MSVYQEILWFELEFAYEMSMNATSPEQRQMWLETLKLAIREYKAGM